MILLNLREPQALYCPRCEKPMSQHIDGECEKPKISRRFFLGGLGLTVAGTAAGLAFAEKAQAAMQDVEVAPVAAPDGTESAIVAATPKVYKGGPIILTFQSCDDAKLRQNMNRDYLQSVADREGRRVIYRDNGTVTVFEPNSGAFDKKWTSPSLAFYNGHQK